MNCSVAVKGKLGEKESLVLTSSKYCGITEGIITVPAVHALLFYERI